VSDSTTASKLTADNKKRRGNRLVSPLFLEGIEGIEVIEAIETIDVIDFL
jgi:hypothetical protein